MSKPLYYNKTEYGITCMLCPHNCRIPNGGAGFCRVRKNENGELTLPYYGMVSSLALDPIEKKPLRMFRPGSYILSVGGYSCNMRCAWCQNHAISMSLPQMEYLPPDELAATALALVSKGNIGVAYTYNEMLIHFEYVLESAKAVKKAGLVNVLVTNGLINREPLLELLQYTHALNVDIKSPDEELYHKISGDLLTSYNTLALADTFCHVEATYLIIPGINDKTSDIEKTALELSRIADIPLHLTRFYPRYKMTNKKSPDTETVSRLCNAAKKYLSNVFI